MHLHLIDGSTFAIAAWAANPKLTLDGKPVGAVLGFVESMWRLMIRHRGNASHMAVVMDGGHSGRGEIDPAYKGNRKPKAPDLIQQWPLMDEAVGVLSMPLIRHPGFESDDVMATYAHQITAAGGRVTLHTVDKDLWQLLALPGTTIICPRTKRIGDGEQSCIDRYGVTPRQLGDWLALVSDTSDNITGVTGIGPGTAAKLLAHCGDLETLLAAVNDPKASRALPRLTDKQLHALRTQQDTARLARRLVELRTDLTGLPPLDALGIATVNHDRLRGWLTGMRFTGLMQRIERDLAPVDENFAAWPI